MVEAELPRKWGQSPPKLKTSAQIGHNILYLRTVEDSFICKSKFFCVQRNPLDFFWVQSNPRVPVSRCLCLRLHLFQQIFRDIAITILNVAGRNDIALTLAGLSWKFTTRSFPYLKKIILKTGLNHNPF